MEFVVEQPPVDPEQDMSRPARHQVPGPVTSQSNRGGAAGGEVNIWSGRRSGPRAPRERNEERKRALSGYRCAPKTDVGRTRGSQGRINTFCLFFAKGMCYQGSTCTFLHRLPTKADQDAYAQSTSMDIFGREKLPDAMDNRKGAGSYERDMTNLYIFYGGAGAYSAQQLHHLILENFGEFGPIRAVHVVPSKTIAFVRYHWRVSAEFAKEAMDGQHLLGSKMSEVLDVRWASEDPNPVAVVAKKRTALDMAEQAAMAAWDRMDPDEKRARLAAAQAARARTVSEVAAAMPEPLLHPGSAPDSFAAWRGFEGRGTAQRLQQQQQQTQQPTNGAGAGEQNQQQPAWQAAGYADEQSYLAAWQAYYASQQQAQQQQAQQQQRQEAEPGSWYKGWRERGAPAGLGSSEAAAQQPGAPAAAAAAAAAAGEQDAGGGASAAALGLLAGYGSGSDSDAEEAQPAATDAGEHQPAAAAGAES